MPLKIRENCPEVDTKKTFVTVVYRFVEGKAVITPVKIGRSDATHTILLSGVTDEDLIVVGPFKELEKLNHEQPLRDERVVEKEKEAKKKAGEKKTKDRDSGKEKITG